MLILLSPAKRLEFDLEYNLKTSKPVLLKESKEILSEAQKLSVKDLEKLMTISKKLAELNFQRFKDLDLGYESGIFAPAIYAFRGDVYQGADFLSLNEEELNTANQKIRILSGFYGILRPFDLISPYRLEMGSSLKIGKAKNLYEFWKNKITQFLNAEIKETKTKVLLNLASVEYSSAVDFSKINAEVLKVDFKERKSGKLQTIGLFAKRARGMMARFIIKNNINSFEEIIKFNEAGYKFDASLSKGDTLVFVR